MSEDPKGFDAGDYNLFRYVGNDPLDRVDPMGLDDHARTQAEVNTVMASASERIAQEQMANQSTIAGNRALSAIKVERLVKQIFQDATAAAKHCVELSQQEPERGSRGNPNGKHMEERRIDGYIDPATGALKQTDVSRGNTREVDGVQKHVCPQPALPPGVPEQNRVYQAFSHVPGSGYHETGDLVSACNQGKNKGAYPLISAIAVTGDGGRKVQFYVPSASSRERQRLAGGKIFYTTNGIDFSR